MGLAEPESLEFVFPVTGDSRVRELTRAKLVEVKLGPVAEALFISDSFEFLDLLFTVGFNEFLDDHVSSSDSDDQFSVDDLCVDFTSSKHVESIAKSSDGDGAARDTQVVGKQFVNLISFDGFVVGLGLSKKFFKFSHSSNSLVVNGLKFLQFCVSLLNDLL